MNLQKERHLLKKFPNIFKRSKLSYEENAIFFESMSELISTGVPIVKIFDIIDIKVKDKKILSDIKTNISNGVSLSTALQNTDIFSNLTISIIKMGEETGNLKISFEKLSKYYYKLSESRKNIKTASFYPMILSVSILFLLIFINYYFIPQIVNLYSYDLSKLNVFSRTLFMISLFLNDYKLESSLMMISLISIIYLFFEDLYENRDDNNFLQKIPVISKLAVSNAMANILWSYSIMTSAGIDIIKSTEILSERTRNKFIKSKLKLLKESISLGKSISYSVESLNLDDDMLKYFISIGEKTGNMEKYLSILSDRYSKKLSNEIKYISEIIQPVLIIVITFIVGIIIAGVVLPVLNYDNIL